MKVLGLTGGAGMGKSTAAMALKELRVPVVDTDLLARSIVEPGCPALAEIQSAFGPQVLAADGRLRRDELARIVFSDPAARRKLEDITHPRIRELWLKQAESWRAEGRPVAVVVIPLLFETRADRHFDATICAACSAETQRRRLTDRGWTAAEIERRLSAQWPIGEKIAKATFVVWTEGGVDVLSAQLDRILHPRRSFVVSLP